MSSALEVPARFPRVIGVDPFVWHSPDPPPDPKHRSSYQGGVRVGNPIRGTLSKSRALQQRESGHPSDYRGPVPHPALEVRARPILPSAPARGGRITLTPRARIDGSALAIRDPRGRSLPHNVRPECSGQPAPYRRFMGVPRTSIGHDHASADPRAPGAAYGGGAHQI